KTRCQATTPSKPEGPPGSQRDGDMGCEKLEQDVSCRVPVPIKHRVALGAAEALVTAQLVMQMSTCSAGLGGVLFRDDVHLAPWVLACLVQKMLPEAEMTQSQHG